MRMIAKTMNTIAIVFTVSVLLSVAVLMGPKLFGLNPYIVESGSMEPLIPTGGIAYINTHGTNVKIGDVVTFSIGDGDGDKLVTHRIIREENGEWITKGDANDMEDANPVSKDKVVGTYAYTIPKLGFLMAKQKRLILFLAFCVLGLNGLSMLLNSLAESDSASVMKEK